MDRALQPLLDYVVCIFSLLPSFIPEHIHIGIMRT